MARSEDNIIASVPNVIINGKTINIEVQNEYIIMGDIIEHKWFTYQNDTSALNKKINALTGYPHANNTLMLAALDDATNLL